MQWRRRAPGGQHNRSPSDGGFSLIEVAVAVGLIFSTVMVIAYSGIVALIDVSHSRQRQGATGLANEALEQVRALPFATVALGLVTSDIETLADPNITRTGTAAPYSYTYRGEAIPYGAHTSVTPLFPHRRTVTVEQTQYTVSTYVTRYANSMTNNTLRATTEVVWANPMRKGVAPKVEAQTVLHPGGGCQSTTTHPYSGPCLAFFKGLAQTQPGSISITGWILDTTATGTRNVPTEALLLLPVQRSAINLEQVAQVQSVVEGSGVILTTDGFERVAGRFAVTTGADTDPSTARSGYESTTATDAAVALLSGVANLIAVRPSTTGGGTASSAAAASLPSASCVLDGISESDEQPCTRAEVQQPWAMDATLDVTHPAALGPFSLASVEPGGGQAAEQFGFVDRVQSGTTGCVGPTHGCARSIARRGLNEVRLGGIPTAAQPLGWGGYLVRISDLSDAVEAHAGSGVPEPTATRAGTIQWWNGAGYTLPTDLASAPASITSTLNQTSGGVTVDLVASLAVAQPTATPDACTAPCDLPEALASAPSPLTGEISYRLTVGATVVADLVIRVDLGAVNASSSYKEPADAA